MSAENALGHKNTPALHYAEKSINYGSELDVADEMRSAGGDKVVLEKGSGLCFHCYSTT
jgi:hypothetical protein